MENLNERNERFFNELREDCKNQGREFKEPTKNLSKFDRRCILKIKKYNTYQLYIAFREAWSLTGELLQGGESHLEWCYYYTLFMLIEHERRFGKCS